MNGRARGDARRRRDAAPLTDRHPRTTHTINWLNATTLVLDRLDTRLWKDAQLWKLELAPTTLSLLYGKEP